MDQGNKDCNSDDESVSLGRPVLQATGSWHRLLNSGCKFSSRLCGIVKSYDGLDNNSWLWNVRVHGGRRGLNNMVGVGVVQDNGLDLR